MRSSLPQPRPRPEGKPAGPHPSLRRELDSCPPPPTAQFLPPLRRLGLPSPLRRQPNSCRPLHRQLCFLLPPSPAARVPAEQAGETGPPYARGVPLTARARPHAADDGVRLGPPSPRLGSSPARRRPGRLALTSIVRAT